jgi:hypothetical protein
VFNNEAKHLFDIDVLVNIRIDDSFCITRSIVLRGKIGVNSRSEDVLLLVNIEDILNQYQHLEHYLDQMNACADQIHAEANRTGIYILWKFVDYTE